MAKAPLLIIKLGGSVITDKTKSVPTPNLTVMNKLAKQIKKLTASSNYRLVLVHGAGSYGHPIVKKHKLHLGMKDSKQKIAFSLTHQSMTNLNTLFIQCLLSHDIPASAIPPHSFITSTDGSVFTFNYSVVDSLLVLGIIPVLYGDAIVDNTKGCSILSGDVIVSSLARELMADKILFLSDVDGIFDSDPQKNPHATLIPEVNNDNLKQIIEKIESTHEFDVTGQMKGKILTIKKDLSGVSVIIGNGFKEDTIERLLTLTPPCSRLHFD